MPELHHHVLPQQKGAMRSVLRRPGAPRSSEGGQGRAIPIVRLGAGQAILVYASAELGIGKKHAKWQSTSGVGYKYLPSVKIDLSKCDNGGACIDICPKKVFVKKDGKVIIENEAGCTMCMACVDVCKNSQAVKVEGDKSKFVFEFETDGSVTAKQALVKALAILNRSSRIFVSSFPPWKRPKPSNPNLFIFCSAQSSSGAELSSDSSGASSALKSSMLSSDAGSSSQPAPS